MPNEKRKNKTAREDVTGSVLQSPHRTTGRKRQEKRIASGNQRRGQARSAHEAERGESASAGLSRFLDAVCAIFSLNRN